LRITKRIEEVRRPRFSPGMHDWLLAKSEQGTTEPIYSEVGNPLNGILDPDEEKLRVSN